MKRLLSVVLLAFVGCGRAPVPVVVSGPVPSSTPAPSVDPALTASAPASAPAPPWGTDDALASYADELVAAKGKNWGEAYSLTGILAVAKDGKPIFIHAYGKANRDTGAVADADTRFRIGSVTKQFTAVCVLQLAEQGKLKIEDTIRTYLPDYPRKTGDKITLHQLLSHTSGIPSYTDDEALMKTDAKDHTPAEVLATFQDKPLHFEPGTQWQYSNSNFFLLGLVVEKVSGQTYERYLQDHVLGPAGMTRTSTIDAPDAPDTAVGYSGGPPDGDGPLTPVKMISMTLPFAAGALRSTVTDLLRWDRALMGTTLLSEASKARMFTPVLHEYGYGIGVRTVAGHTVLEHSGGIDGFASVLTRIPDQGLAIVVLSNDQVPPSDVAEALMSMLLEGKRTPPPQEREVVPMTSDLVARAVGDYAMSADSRKELEGKLPKQLMADIARIQISADGLQLSFKPNGQSKARIFWGGGAAFFTKGGDIEITLQGDPAGPAKAFVLTQGELATRYERSKR